MIQHIKTTKSETLNIAAANVDMTDMIFTVRNFYRVYAVYNVLSETTM